MPAPERRNRRSRLCEVWTLNLLLLIAHLTYNWAYWPVAPCLIATNLSFLSVEISATNTMSRIRTYTACQTMSQRSRVYISIPLSYPNRKFVFHVVG
ncbi:hypothetical protein BV25DRAFT_1821189 [Artomyces pyxidatus]|uniref:Uncharacterized protein n=1 Tax=Artomyces pyxidatus TaxID=48021 RepID=A0ACB8TBR5_9AGAM|nr:hypothetical protein BV25DRAFT_1821189 [Artomyces pyxidatus]